MILDINNFGLLIRILIAYLLLLFLGTLDRQNLRRC